MVRTFDTRRNDRSSVVSVDELAVHLREAGAQGVYLSRTDAFRDGRLPVVATYEIPPSGDEHESRVASGREMLVAVFEAIDHRLWFHDRAWTLEWEVEPAFEKPRSNLFPIYDRTVECAHGDGFNLWNLLFLYEEYRTVRDES